MSGVSADEIISILQDAGACAVGMTPLSIVPDSEMAAFDRWLDEGCNARMDYMRNHRHIRRDPSLLLEGSRSIISMAFSYPGSHSVIASYALGVDYHDAIREALTPAIAIFKERYGGEYRICVDSAPVLERYWAQKCGVGRRTRNGLIAVPGVGSRVFLAEIVTTLDLPSHSPQDALKCVSEGKYMPDAFCNDDCRLCRTSCPAGALREDGTVDARRCLSYLTIEHRGEWDATGQMAMHTPAGKRTLFGCELCLRACPLNRLNNNEENNGQNSGKYLSAFEPRKEIMAVTPAEVLTMTQEDFSRTFRQSPIKRAKLPGLQRNARNMIK